MKSGIKGSHFAVKGQKWHSACKKRMYRVYQEEKGLLKTFNDF